MPRRLEKGKGLVKEGTTPPNKPKDFTRPVEEKNIEHTTLSIPENFKQIGGKSDLSNATVIFIAERHSYNHFKDNVALLKQWASNGDILLIEGHPSMEPITTQGWLTSEYTRYSGEPVTLTKQLDIYGWDNLEANQKLSQMYKVERILAKEIQHAQAKRNLPNLHRLNASSTRTQKRVQEYMEERDQSLLTTLDLAVTKFHTKRKIFIIAGSNHYTENKVIQEAVATHSSIVLQTTRLMTEAEID